MRKLLRSLLLGLAVLAPSAHADIVIGHVLPLSGPDAASGNQMRLGAKAYIDQVNAMGGVAGQRVVYVASDDAGRPAQTVARARELIVKDRVNGLLGGTSVAGLRAVSNSGLLGKYRVPMVGGDAQADAGSAARMRRAGLVEVAFARQSASALQEEFKLAMARQGAQGQADEAALQGYIAAKVMVGALRLLGDEPLVQGEFYALMRNMVPDLSNYLISRDQAPA